MMPKNYDDFVRAMAALKESGESVDRAVLTSDTLDVFLTDGNFNEDVEETHDELGEFEVPIERGDGNYLVAESGEEFDL